MTRASRKGYLAPWSSRRETAGLMGTFVIFLLGFPAHSEIMIDQMRHLAHQLIEVVLVFLGLVSPVQTVSVAVPVASPVPLHQKLHSQKVAAPHAATATLAPLVSAPVAEPDSNHMAFHIAPFLRHLNYVFEGKATFKGQVCSNASVLIRLTSGDQTVTKGTVTNADGSYSVPIGIDAPDKGAVDWSIQAYTPDFNQVEITGRRIVPEEIEQEKAPMVVDTPVEFLVSLSK